MKRNLVFLLLVIFSAPALSQDSIVVAKELKGVEVTARKSLIEIRADKTVFNVRNSINATGSNALELLQKIPGIGVDNNDNISIKGKTGVKIYIDGKMLQLGAEDLAGYLKNINSNDIEAIELITNPGAKYDAGGSAGVLNIRLRKNANYGSNGSVGAGYIQGKTPKGNASGNFNYRNRKINLFSAASAAGGKYATDIIAPRIQKDTLYHQLLEQVSNSKSFNLKTGIDFFLNKNETIGLMNTTNHNTDDWASYGNTQITYNPTHQYLKKLWALNEIPRRRTSINNNLNYRYADTMGREINVDIDYGLYRGRAKSFQPNYYYDESDALMAEVITFNNTPTDIDILTGKIDMAIKKWKGKLDYGAKISYVETDNTLDFFNEENNSKVKVADRSYNFVYKENVNAVYASFHRQESALWSWQAGIRLEQTNSEGILTRGDGVVQDDNNVKRNYLDFFPNITINFSPGKNNRFGLGYGRRIDRPNYQGLNPFELKLDELSYVKGNSFLRPQYTDNIELSYSWKGKINIVAAYSHVRDLATQTVDTLNNYTYAVARNLASQDIFSFTVSAPVSITKWWNAFLNGWANYQVYKGGVNNDFVHFRLPSAGAFMQHSFTMSKDFSAELSGWINGPSALGPTLKARSMGGLDAGIQQLLLHGKATIKITATDIFRTAIPFRAKTDFGGVLLRFWVTRESQTFRMNFTYHFGNNKVKASRQRITGSETESKRIKEN